MATRSVNFFFKLEETTRRCVSAGRSDLAQLYGQVEAYASRGEFTRAHDYANFYRLIGLSAPVAAQHLGCSAEAVRVKRKSISDQLYKLFGKDFFDLVYLENAYDVISERIYRVTRVSTDIVDHLVIPELILHVKDVEYPADIQFRDCQYEASVLLKYSLPSLKTTLELADEKKMAFLLDVLAGRRGTVEEITSLTKAIKNAEIVQPHLSEGE